MSTSSFKGDPVRKHKRDVWLKIVAPIVLPFIALVVLCIVLVASVAGGTLESKQITIVMSILATAFITLPLAILCLVPYALLAVLAHASGRGYAHVRTPLRLIRDLTGGVAATTHAVAPKLARPLIAVNVRLARWEATLLGPRKPVLPVERKATHE